jgi:hypothetical protein
MTDAADAAAGGLPGRSAERPRRITMKAQYNEGELRWRRTIERNLAPLRPGFAADAGLTFVPQLIH